MLIISKSRHAILVMLSLAMSEKNTPKTISDIANQHNISTSYMEQIFRSLKQKNLVKAIKGPGGGYIIAKKPNEITIKKIISSVVDNKNCKRNMDSELYEFARMLEDLELNIQNNLDKISLNDILKKNCNIKRQINISQNNTKRIFLDYNAGTPMDKVVMESMMECTYYNPSSIHKDGQASRHRIEVVRQLLLQSLNASNDFDAIFTSSGTEANNLALRGLASHKHFISAGEHKSVLESAIEPTIIPLDSDGIIDFNYLAQKLDCCKQPILLSIALANNETGVVQPTEKIIALKHKYDNIILHLDTVQSFGKIPLNLETTNIDMISISSHKIGGPFGVGALVCNKNIPIKPIIFGGGQEKSLRAGTENIMSIVGFGTALQNLPTLTSQRNIQHLRDTLENNIMQIAPNVIIPGRNSLRIHNTSCIITPGIKNDIQLIEFDLNGISVSSGSACSSGRIETSHVLLAMGIKNSLANCAIRVSIGKNTTVDDIFGFVNCWESIYKKSVFHSG